LLNETSARANTGGDSFTPTLGGVDLRRSDLYWVRVEGGRVKTANAGFSFPTANQQMNGYALYDKATWDAADAAYKNGTNFLYDSGAPEPLLFLPAAGLRVSATGAVNSVGTYGSYWSSTYLNTTDAYRLNFHGTNVTATSLHNRAFGFSVRCVTEP